MDIFGSKKLSTGFFFSPNCLSVSLLQHPIHSCFIVFFHKIWESKLAISIDSVSVRITARLFLVMEILLPFSLMHSNVENLYHN